MRSTQYRATRAAVTESRPLLGAVQGLRMSKVAQWRGIQLITSITRVLVQAVVELQATSAFIRRSRLTC